MKLTINLNQTNHLFSIKENLVTLKDSKGMHDNLKCTYCGVKGKSYALGTITLNKSEIYCKKAPKFKKNKILVKVLYCTAGGSEFKNMKIGSIHKVIAPPFGEIDVPNGVWVMGVKEPVKLLNNEFEVYLKRTK